MTELSKRQKRICDVENNVSKLDMIKSECFNTKNI